MAGRMKPFYSSSHLLVWRGAAQAKTKCTNGKAHRPGIASNAAHDAQDLTAPGRGGFIVSSRRSRSRRRLGKVQKAGLRTLRAFSFQPQKSGRRLILMPCMVGQMPGTSREQLQTPHMVCTALPRGGKGGIIEAERKRTRLTQTDRTMKSTARA